MAQMPVPVPTSRIRDGLSRGARYSLSPHNSVERWCKMSKRSAPRSSLGRKYESRNLVLYVRPSIAKTSNPERRYPPQTATVDQLSESSSSSAQHAPFASPPTLSDASDSPGCGKIGRMWWSSHNVVCVLLSFSSSWLMLRGPLLGATEAPPRWVSTTAGGCWTLERGNRELFDPWRIASLGYRILGCFVTRQTLLNWEILAWRSSAVLFRGNAVVWSRELS